MVGGGRALLPEILGQIDPPSSKTAISSLPCEAKNCTVLFLYIFIFVYFCFVFLPMAL